jgi:hypothetical protein
VSAGLPPDPAVAVPVRYVCSDFASREAMRERVGLAPIPLAHWPRSADELAMEDDWNEQARG